jgi:hypothetical protein
LSTEDIEFEFVNGTYEASPAPGIDRFYTGPYYSFYESTEQECLERAHIWLNSTIQSQGPYDSVMCFSQGSALIATYLLARQRKGELPGFKSVMFICGGIPLDFLETLGVHVSESMREYDEMSRAALSQQASLDALLTRGEQRWDGVSSASGLLHLDGAKLDGNSSTLEDAPKIMIPTAHVVGCKDARHSAGLQLASYCEQTTRRIFDHGGGHTIPRTQWVSQNMAALLIWMKEQSD